MTNVKNFFPTKYNAQDFNFIKHKVNTRLSISRENYTYQQNYEILLFYGVFMVHNFV